MLLRRGRRERKEAEIAVGGRASGRRDGDGDGDGERLCVLLLVWVAGDVANWPWEKWMEAGGGGDW